jgi:hypothetical protein
VCVYLYTHTKEALGAQISQRAPSPQGRGRLTSSYFSFLAACKHRHPPGTREGQIPEPRGAGGGGAAAPAPSRGTNSRAPPPPIAPPPQKKICIEASAKLRGRTRSAHQRRCRGSETVGSSRARRRRTLSRTHTHSLTHPSYRDRFISLSHPPPPPLPPPPPPLNPHPQIPLIPLSVRTSGGGTAACCTYNGTSSSSLTLFLPHPMCRILFFSPRAWNPPPPILHPSPPLPGATGAAMPRFS